MSLMMDILEDELLIGWEMDRGMDVKNVSLFENIVFELIGICY